MLKSRKDKENKTRRGERGDYWGENLDRVLPTDIRS